MMTAGIAAARPNAVASSASAMPGATTARLVVCSFEMPMKLFMMPHTVPNRPTNGAVATLAAGAGLDALDTCCDAFLDAVNITDVRRTAQFGFDGGNQLSYVRTRGR